MKTINKKTVLVVDDEPDILAAVNKILKKENFAVLTANSATLALSILEKKSVNIVVSDLVMDGMDGVELLRRVKKSYPEIEFVLLTAFGTVETAVEAMRQGAYDFIAKPFKRVTLLKAIQKAIEKQNLEKENRYLREQLEGQQKNRFLVGNSPALQEVMAWVKRVGPVNSTVLITGESGTGKELVARAIHQHSLRKNSRFVAINCGAIPESLMESELFGHERGAFTGAIRDKDGYFATASGGTLFLDEIGNIPSSLQVKLLRAIEEKEIYRVGSSHPIPVDVRIIAATNRDLLTEVEAGRFREDLYYRVNVVGIEIPPLRERRDDIPALVEHFIRIHNVELNKSIKKADEDTLGVLCSLEWKGNVRELDNILERAMILCDEDEIRLRHLPEGIRNVQRGGGENTQLKEVVNNFERVHIERILRQFDNDKARAAKALGLSQSSLYRKMSQLNIPTSVSGS